MKRILANDNPEDVYKKDYHGHPKYFVIFISLLILMGVSLYPTFFNISTVGIVVASVFIVSVVKAGLVMANFMHIRFEPLPTLGMMAFGLLCLATFFFGVLLDMPTKKMTALRYANTIPRINLQILPEMGKTNAENFKMKLDKIKAVMHEYHEKHK